MATLENVEFGWILCQQMTFVSLNSLKFSPTKILYYMVYVHVHFCSSFIMLYGMYVLVGSYDYVVS